METETNTETNTVNPFRMSEVSESEGPVAQPNYYAGFWIRVLAIIIDGIILLIAFLPLSYIMEIGTLTQTVLQLVYFIILTSMWGQTLGKKVVGIKVVRQDGLPLTWGTVILRETIGKIVSGIILFIGYIMAAFTDEKKALHDMIAKTYVVKAK